MIFNMGGGGAIAGSGSGAGLNFKIIGGTTAPKNPRENTIWINTNTKITNWTFSNTEPTEKTQGVIWIYCGNSSDVSFNVLKRNDIQIYPVGAYQYISGSWVKKEAKTYQDGEWIDWTMYLYYLLNDYTDITGGWTNGDSQNATTTTISIDETGVFTFSLSVADAATGRQGWVHTTNDVDLTDYSKVCVNITKDYNGSSRGASHEIRVGTDHWGKDAYTTITDNTAGLYEVDVSGLTGMYKITIFVQAQVGPEGHTISFDSIWLE